MAEQASEVKVTEPDLNELTEDTFQRVGEYLAGELDASAEDYTMLEKMNKITTTKYAEMKQMVTGVNKSVEQLNSKYTALMPYIDQIDQIEAAVTALEQSAYKLDAYSKQLEARYKQLEKR